MDIQWHCIDAFTISNSKDCCEYKINTFSKIIKQKENF